MDEKKFVETAHKLIVIIILQQKEASNAKQK